MKEVRGENKGEQGQSKRYYPVVVVVFLALQVFCSK
jgi:hypothetical protein